MLIFPNLLFWKILSNGSFVNVLFFTVLHFLLQPLDSVSLHITSRHKHRLQGSETKVIVRLVGQLFIAQSSEERKGIFQCFELVNTMCGNENYQI